MKAADFRYERPADLAAALALMGDTERDVAALAGGQSLMPMMNFRVAQPDVLVDLAGVEEMRGISLADGRARIGAMTRYAEIERHATLLAAVPLMARALPFIAHSAIRNRGTLGGSVGLADPAAEMPAVLCALGAEVVVAGAGGERRVAADDFFLGAYETALEPGELIVALDIPVARAGDRFGFHEVARRHGDYAMAGVAIARADGAAPRIAFFAISDRPIRATAAEEALAEGAGLDAAITKLSDLPAEADLNASEPMKRHLAGVVLRRAWEEMSA